jgi:hypothetical protein
MILFVRILEKCGTGSECEMNYQRLCEAIGQPEATLKHWAAALQERGYITKTKAAHGSLVRVHLDRLPVPDVDSNDKGTAHDAALEFIKGLRGTVIAACDGFINGQKVGAQ